MRKMPLFITSHLGTTNSERFRAMSIYDYSATDIRGQEVSLADYEDQVVLIVNTASKCGFTPQFEGLEA